MPKAGYVIGGGRGGSGSERRTESQRHVVIGLACCLSVRVLTISSRNYTRLQGDG
jgi:hypothetical protein